MFSLLLALFILHCILLVVFYWGWKKALSTSPASGDTAVFFSVLVPFRNEASRLHQIISDLKVQHFSNFEVLLIDDHSTDNAVEGIRPEISTDSRFRLLKNSGQGKKYALQDGVSQSRGDVIVTTDADCRLPSRWLSSLSDHFANPRVDLVIGPVRIEQHTFFSSLQAIEFSALMGVTGATVALGYPVMCNGANLAVRKSTFNEVGGYDGNLHIASGDDEFLMRKIANRKGTMVFMTEAGGVVQAKAAATLSEFLSQRLRWASKWRYNSSSAAVMLAILVFVSQVATIGGHIFLVTGKAVGWVAGILLIKALLEFLFLQPVCRFLKVKWNWLAFAVLQIIYPYYVVGIGLFSNFLPISWKGRRI